MKIVQAIKISHNLAEVPVDAIILSAEELNTGFGAKEVELLVFGTPGPTIEREYVILSVNDQTALDTLLFITEIHQKDVRSRDWNPRKFLFEIIK